MKRKKRLIYAMLCGILGCFCYGGGDWLMMYGNPEHSGKLFWLSKGVADITPWRNTLAMALAFPGIILYGIALFALRELVTQKRQKKVYTVLNAFGLTPWISLHLLYIMILYLFSWLNGNGYAQSAVEICEALYSNFSWVIVVSEAVMLPPFVYWFAVVAGGKTVMPKAAALVNPLVFYALLYAVKCALPDSAFKIGFTNGLMSESMIICFVLWAIIINRFYSGKTLDANNC